jgi:hypothetical protein
MRRWSADVARRLRLNQQLATRSAKDPESALLRGLARCGLCGRTVHANRMPSYARIDGSIPTRYICRNSLNVKKDDKAGRYCYPHSALANELDGAVWAKVAEALQDPDLIRQELERMQKAELPGTEDLAVLDAKILALGNRVSGLIETAQYATNSDARRDLAGQIDILTQQKRETEVERAKVAHLAAAWDRERADLESVPELVARIGADLEKWDYADKRSALLGLKASVILYPRGHTPRAELTIRLPLRGTVTLSSVVDSVR